MHPTCVIRYEPGACSASLGQPPFSSASISFPYSWSSKVSVTSGLGNLQRPTYYQEEYKGLVAVPWWGRLRDSSHHSCGGDEITVPQAREISV